MVELLVVLYGVEILENEETLASFIEVEFGVVVEAECLTPFVFDQDQEEALINSRIW